jgi:hypothetical protein
LFLVSPLDSRELFGPFANRSNYKFRFGGDI